jgi:hypothetical protein
MYRVYGIFEILPNGSPQRVSVVSGLESAKARLHELANSTKNECFAADVRTHQIVALMNVPPSKRQTTKHIFQISYNEDIGLRTTELLKSQGYGVISVIGNQAAKVVLSSIQHYDLFVVGQAAPEEIREEMVLWLKARYAGVKIVVLNPPNEQVSKADYNVQQNGPESLLSIISQVFANSLDNPQLSKASNSALFFPFLRRSRRR